MREKIELLAMFTIVPFIATASVQFLPWWVSAPIVLICVVVWIGTMAMIGEKF